MEDAIIKLVPRTKSRIKIETTGLPTSEMFLGAYDNPFEVPFRFHGSYSCKTIIIRRFKGVLEF